MKGNISVGRNEGKDIIKVSSLEIIHYYTSDQNTLLSEQHISWNDDLQSLRTEMLVIFSKFICSDGE